MRFPKVLKMLNIFDLGSALDIHVRWWGLSDIVVYTQKLFVNLFVDCFIKSGQDDICVNVEHKL